MAAIIPHQNDVLLGCGNAVNTHPGNRRLRAMVDARKGQFREERDRKAKRAIARSVIHGIQSLSPPGRFLAEDRGGRGGVGDGPVPPDIHPVILSKAWTEVGFDAAMAKVMHRLREKDYIPRGDQKRPGQGGGPKSSAAQADGVPARGDTEPMSPTSGATEQKSIPKISDASDEQAGKLESASKRYHGIVPDPVLVNPGGGGECANFPVGNGPADQETDSLLLDFLRRDDDGIDSVTREETLQEWIERAGSIGHSSDQVSEYVRSSLPVALKLTEFLVEAEKEAQSCEGNPIPLASIAPQNTLVRSKEVRSVEGSEQVVEYACIMSCVGDNPASGGIMQRMYALGVVLYKLFAREEPLVEDASIGANQSVKSISLRDDTNGQRLQKRSQRQGVSSDSMLQLETKGMPWALCSLVDNLLDCRNGDFCGDEAYTSLEDLLLDLRLMIKDPSRFLDDVDENSLLPLPNEIYGRDDEIARLEHSYEQHLIGRCGGVLIAGIAGAGKSRLTVHVLEQLSNKQDCYFLSAKFDQSRELNPLSTIGAMFSILCDWFVQDATPAQMDAVEQELERALGDQAGVLAAMVPSLFKVMPSCVWSEASGSCIDSAQSLQFQFGELFKVMISGSKPLLIFLDDIQRADSAALLLISALLFNAVGNQVFFAFAYRDNEVADGVLDTWLGSIAMFSLEAIKLGNMSVEGANQLLSDTLRRSPRITRPLASVLHHKSGGNPLFLRQLIDSLREQQYLYVQRNPPRFAWDLEKIAELKISDDVLALLIEEMQRLPGDLQLGLKVASCMGSRVTQNVLDILSKDMELDLVDVLKRVSIRGFLDCIDGVIFSFSHDKIEQAAYELMSEDEKRRNHMRFGLALCTQAMNAGIEKNDDLFFSAVNQINLGGPAVVQEQKQRDIIAGVNLKAGYRAMNLSDVATAFKLFKHGISFLSEDHWSSQYERSLNLLDGAAEAACVLDKRGEVSFYAEQVIAHASCLDDKLACMYCITKALRNAQRLPEVIESASKILIQVGEGLPRAAGDETLMHDIQLMNNILQSTSDDFILGMKEIEAHEKKILTLMKLYTLLADVFLFTKPSLLDSVSFRMVQITMNSGLSNVSPTAFGYYGKQMMSNGHIAEGCRMGRLALKLLNHKPALSAFKSSTFGTIYQMVLWAAEPLQSVAGGHTSGHKAGLQSGDVLYARINFYLSLQTAYVAGQNLDGVSNSLQQYIEQGHRQKNPMFIDIARLLMLHIDQLRGLQMNDEYDCEEAGLLATASGRNDANHSLVCKVYRLVKSFLFRQSDGMSHNADMSDVLKQQNHSLRPIVLMGLFFEGLASFNLARSGEAMLCEAESWMKRGEAILAKFRHWYSHSAWNWESKMLLLEAERMHSLGRNDDEAVALLYDRAVRSARDHKFIHDEAISSELAGVFFLDRGLYAKSMDFFLHSVQCYRNWGALAVAERVEEFAASKFGSEFGLLRPRDISELISDAPVSSKKRPA